MSDGAAVAIRGVALTDSTFADGGGYLVDATAGIAVLLSNGSFARGTELVVHGTIDDRYAQRTIRADAAGVEILGTGADPVPQPASTAAVGESIEGRAGRAVRHDRRRPDEPRRRNRHPAR